MGCYKDRPDRAIPGIEGTDPVLDGDYLNRHNAIVKCAVAARRKDFKMFALQDGGWCASSATAWDTHYKYGQSLDCKEDGEGGDWANNVYVFEDDVKSKFILVVFISKRPQKTKYWKGKKSVYIIAGL